MRIVLSIILAFAFLNVFSSSNEEVHGRCIQFKYLTSINASVKNEKPNPVWLNFLKKQNNRKRIIASALAFPLPFGWIGVHRLYLGTQPYIPLIYAGTLGGCVGILPLIDFIHLVGNKDISHFQNNPHVFMWVDNDPKK